MPNYTKVLYGSSTASTNDLAHVDLASNCYLLGVSIVIAPTAFANGDRIVAEISTASVSQNATNDAVGIVAFAAFAYQFTTSGAAVPAMHYFNGPISYPFRAGTRVYLHTTQNQTSASIIRVILHLRSGR